MSAFDAIHTVCGTGETCKICLVPTRFVRIVYNDSANGLISAMK
jgi:hypothetical protein